MDVLDKDLWETAKQFLTDCKGQKTHVIHDFDVDGITGGCMMLHALDRIGALASSSTRKGRFAPLLPEELERIKETFDPQRIVITDQDPKSYEVWEDIKRIFPEVPVLIVDHHFVQTYDDAVFIHPKHIFDIDGAKYCSAKFIFDLCNEVVNIQDLSWLACAGILGDANAKYFPEFMQESINKEGYEMPSDPYDSIFADISEAIECCACTGEEELLTYVEAIKHAKTLKQALSLGNPCIGVKEAVEETKKRALDQVSDSLFVWVDTENKFNIGSWAMTVASMEQKDKCFMGFRPEKNGFTISFRWQNNKVHLGEVVKKITAAHGGKGGGHAPASGGWVPGENWEAFKQSFEQEINNKVIHD